MPVESNRGRGATRNPTPTRFNLKDRAVEGDWLDTVEALDGVPTRRTTVTIEHPRSILTRNNSPDIGFDRSINAFRGCEHGCIYCFARPTHAYHDLSPGLDFESRLFVKPQCRSAAPRRAVAAGLRMPADRDGHQHRPLPADRGKVADHPLGGRVAGRDAATPSPSPPSPTACCAISTCSSPLPSCGWRRSRYR